MLERRVLLGVLVIAGAAALVIRSRVSVVDVQSRAHNIPEIELAPICPWREPQRDLAVFFPSATDYKRETRILSGKRPQMQQRLRRVPTAEENAILIHRITAGAEGLGSVLVRRVKGEHGAIEVVTAIDPRGAVHAVSIQSQREPDVIAQEITATNWLRAFFGKDARASFRVGEDVPEVAPIARASAQAIADGVRSQLVLLSVAEEREQPGYKTYSHP